MLKSIAARGITRLMVEGGPTLAAAFVAADLVDAANLFHSSKRVGPGGIDALAGLPLTTLTQSPRLRCIRNEPVGADTLTVLSEGEAMFTGIVNDLGEVLQVAQKAEGLRRLTVKCGYDPGTIDIGASIACSGICLTVVARGRTRQRRFFAVDAGAETLRVTTAGAWQRGRCSTSNGRFASATNLAATWSAAMSMASRSLSRARVCPDMARLFLQAPAELARFIAPKGSVALDGVSLTVNEVKGDRFSL